MLFFTPDPEFEGAPCTELSEEEREVFYSSNGSEYKVAKKICLTCEARIKCLEKAMDFERGQEWRWGVWGGLAAKERARLAKGAA